MKLTNLKGLTAVMVACATLTAPLMASAVELKYSSAAPANSPWAKMIQVLVDGTAAKTNGEVVIKTFLSNQLGDEATVIQQVARGRVDMGGFSLTAVALVVPELALLSAPFLWDNDEQMACALDQHLVADFQPYFDAHGLVNMGWGEAGYQTVFSQTAITKVSDLADLKIRVAPAKASVLAFKSVDANGIVLPSSDLNASLQTGLITAAEINITFGVLTGVGQQAPIVTKTNHIYLPSLSVMSKKTFSELTKEQQEALMSSSMPPAAQRATLRGVEGALTQKLLAAGGKVIEMDAGERDKLKEKMVATTPDLIKEIGGDAPAAWDLIQKAKAACAG